MIKSKITVNGQHFNDINAAFSDLQHALEKDVSQKKQEIIMKEKAGRIKVDPLSRPKCCKNK